MLPLAKTAAVSSTSFSIDDFGGFRKAKYITSATGVMTQKTTMHPMTQNTLESEGKRTEDQKQDCGPYQVRNTQTAE